MCNEFLIFYMITLKTEGCWLRTLVCSLYLVALVGITMFPDVLNDLSEAQLPYSWLFSNQKILNNCFASISKILFSKLVNFKLNSIGSWLLFMLKMYTGEQLNPSALNITGLH